MEKRMKVLFFCMFAAICLAGCGRQNQSVQTKEQSLAETEDKKQFFRNSGMPEDVIEQLDDQQIIYLSARLHQNEDPVYGGLCGNTADGKQNVRALYFLKVLNEEVQEVVIETMSMPGNLTAFDSESVSSFSWEEEEYIYTGEFFHESGGEQNRKYEIFEEGDTAAQIGKNKLQWSGLLGNPNNNLSVTSVYDNAEIHLKPSQMLPYVNGRNYGASFSYDYSMKDGENMVLKSAVICIMVLVIFVGICWQNQMGPKEYEEEEEV